MLPTHVKTNHGCHELLLKQTSERTLTFWDFRCPPYSYISSSKTIYMYLFICFPPENVMLLYVKHTYSCMLYQHHSVYCSTYKYSSTQDLTVKTQDYLLCKYQSFTDSHQNLTNTLFQDYFIPMLLNMLENLSCLLIFGKSTFIQGKMFADTKWAYRSGKQKGIQYNGEMIKKKSKQINNTKSKRTT